MQLPKTDISEQVTPAVINELQLGDHICAAVEQHRRADFSLLIAMFSEDVRETVSIQHLNLESKTESKLREELQVPKPVELRSNEHSYSKGARISEQFHQGGIQSARLQNGLNPDSLAYMTEHTHNLGEDVFRNLSFHSKRTLKSAPEPTISDHLYKKLVINQIESQIRQVA